MSESDEAYTPEGSESESSIVNARRKQVLYTFSSRKTTATIQAEIDDEPETDTRLGLFDLLCIGIGSTVGSGVFVLSGSVLPVAGPSACISWILAGLACALSGLAYMELSARLPTRGSCYTFSFHGLGEVFAVIGAFCITMEYGISGAGVARNWSEKMAHVIGPGYRKAFYIFWGEGTWPEGTIDRSNLNRTDDHYIDIAAGLMTAGCTLLLMGGLSLSKPVINVMTILKILLVAYMVTMGFVSPEIDIVESSDAFMPEGLSGIIKATTLLFFGFIGFDEARNPARTMPWALIGTLAGAAVISVTAQLALCLNAAPGVATDFPQVFESKGFHVAAWISRIGELVLLPLVVLLSILPQPEVSAPMARDRLLPSIFARQSQRTGNFTWGLALTGLIALTGLATFCPFSVLWDVISLGVLLSFNLSNAALINIRYGNGGSLQQPRLEKLVLLLLLLGMSAGYVLWKGVLGPALGGDEVGTVWIAIGTVLALASIALVAHLRLQYEMEPLPEEKQGKIFMAPGMPFIPGLAIFVNGILMSGISWDNHLVFLALLGAWLALYAAYPCFARARA
ncbi:CAT1 [Symbiodinium sp. KB8]|nr:CAT1 [Symbiodinium sp. KB8]